MFSKNDSSSNLASKWPQNDLRSNLGLSNFLGCMLPHPPSWCLFTSTATGLPAPHIYIYINYRSLVLGPVMFIGTRIHCLCIHAHYQYWIAACQLSVIHCTNDISGDALIWLLGTLVEAVQDDPLSKVLSPWKFCILVLLPGMWVVILWSATWYITFARIANPLQC